MDSYVSPLSLLGADVGGFIGTPGTELLLRWQQMGAWMPFYRVHSDKTSARREAFRDRLLLPFVQKAVLDRYKFMPHMYDYNAHATAAAAAVAAAAAAAAATRGVCIVFLVAAAVPSARGLLLLLLGLMLLLMAGRILYYYILALSLSVSLCLSLCLSVCLSLYVCCVDTLCAWNMQSLGIP